MGARDAAADGLSARLRALPSVERLAAALDAPHPLAVAAAREAIEEARAAILERGEIATSAILREGAAGAETGGDVLSLARERLASAETSSLVRVVNATGVNRQHEPRPRPARRGRTRGRRACRRGLRQPRGSTSPPANAARARTTSRRCCAGSPAPGSRWWSTTARAPRCSRWPRSRRAMRCVVSRGQLGEIGGAFSIERERVLLDPRTMSDDDAEVAGTEVVAALR